MTTPAPAAPVYVALDTTDPVTARGLAAQVAPFVAGIKLGLEFYLANGAAGYRAVAAAGLPIFLDLKLHDIPNTVAGGVRAVAPLGPRYLTLHTQGGPAMMRAAKEAVDMYSPQTKLLGVTVLTSLDGADLSAMGVEAHPSEHVLRLATLALEARLDGIVCSAGEVAMIRRELGDTLELMVPGIRPQGSAAGDQKRVMTPEDALALGATNLVIGRPITAVKDPARAACDIALSVQAARA